MHQWVQSKLKLQALSQSHTFCQATPHCTQAAQLCAAERKEYVRAASAIAMTLSSSEGLAITCCMTEPNVWASGCMCSARACACR